MSVVVDGGRENNDSQKQRWRIEKWESKVEGKGSGGGGRWGGAPHSRAGRQSSPSPLTHSATKPTTTPFACYVLPAYISGPPALRPIPLLSPDSLPAGTQVGRGGARARLPGMYLICTSQTFCLWPACQICTSHVHFRPVPSPPPVLLFSI